MFIWHISCRLAIPSVIEGVGSNSILRYSIFHRFAFFLDRSNGLAWARIRPSCVVLIAFFSVLRIPENIMSPRKMSTNESCKNVVCNRRIMIVFAYDFPTEKCLYGFPISIRPIKRVPNTERFSDVVKSISRPGSPTPATIGVFVQYMGGGSWNVRYLVFSVKSLGRFYL